MKRGCYNKKWPKKNLGELVSLIENEYPEGINLAMLSERVGIAKQYLSYMFKNDKMSLAIAERITNRLGYELKLYFPELRDTPKHPEVMKEYPNAGNLSGLVNLLSQKNISIHYMSSRINKSDSVLKRAFETGDIQLTTLYTIADNLNIDFIWDFVKIENQEQQTYN